MFCKKLAIYEENTARLVSFHFSESFFEYFDQLALNYKIKIHMHLSLLSSPQNLFLAFKHIFLGGFMLFSLLLVFSYGKPIMVSADCHISVTLLDFEVILIFMALNGMI